MSDARTFTSWRLMLIPPRSGAENMARDTALLERARVSREAVFSVYGWDRPTLSLGRNQIARGSYDLGEIARRKFAVVRRPTGGRALLHACEVTYSVTAPIATDGSLRDSYRRINRILIDGLSRLGVNAWEAISPGSPTAPGALPCFAAPADGELVSEDGKLVGSAQVREDGALLQHGSILIEDDQALIAGLLAGGTPQAGVPSAATLSGSLGRAPSTHEVASALFEAVRRLEDVDASPLDESELQDATLRHIEKYSSEWWTWRR